MCTPLCKGAPAACDRPVRIARTTPCSETPMRHDRKILHRAEPEEGKSHRHLCERGGGCPSSSVRRARKGTSSRSCIHPIGRLGRGGRAPEGDPSSGMALCPRIDGP